MFNRIPILLATFMSATALLWLVMAQPVLAAPDLSVVVTFDPPLDNPNTLQVGNTFTATISLVSAGTNPEVETMGFYITFEQDIVQVNSVTTTVGPFTTSCLPDPIFFSNITGTISGDCFGPVTVVSNLDVLEIEFEVLQTDTTFDLAFIPCSTDTSIDCFGAYRTAVNQIDLVNGYNNVVDAPLAVALQSAGVNTAVFPLAALLPFALLLLIATAGTILLRRKSH